MPPLYICTLSSSYSNAWNVKKGRSYSYGASKSCCGPQQIPIYEWSVTLDVLKSNPLTSVQENALINEAVFSKICPPVQLLESHPHPCKLVLNSYPLYIKHIHWQPNNSPNDVTKSLDRTKSIPEPPHFSAQKESPLECQQLLPK